MRWERPEPTAACVAPCRSKPWQTVVYRAFTPSRALQECEEASKRSLQCLMDNEGKRARCGAFFQAYQECNARAAQERKELEKMRDQVRVR